MHYTVVNKTNRTVIDFETMKELVDYYKGDEDKEHLKDLTIKVVHSNGLVEENHIHNNKNVYNFMNEEAL